MDNKPDDKNDFYKPKNKAEREARRIVWDRYREMRDDPIRKEEEKHWDEGDKAFMQWVPERDMGDWRAHIALPDAFAAVQAHMQETIDRRGRPTLESVDSSDLALQMFCNDIMKYSMDRTQFDYQQFLAKQCAAIRGTAFMMEYYRVDKRKIKDPVSVNDDGTLKYVEKEVVDFDDTYTEFIESQYIFTDPSAMHVSKMKDMVHREIIEYKEFKRVYGFYADFMNVDKVRPAGVLTDQVQFFKYAKDLNAQDVEILHYYNRATDEYNVIANNVLIRMGPIPYKHKELPLGIYTHYNIPGRIYGMGIPRVIMSLTEERRSLRNLNLDRQNMQVNKLFLVNDLIDLDDEDVRTRPNGFIPVNTNGMPINNVIQPLEYGDTPVGYYKAEEMLLEDIRRAHGIDDRVQGVQSGGTATEAAILKEAAQKRINLINILADMDSLIRIGRLKWSNIQFFYPVPKIERITQDNEVREKKVYKRIKVQGKEYVVRDTPGGYQLDTSEIEGSSGFELNKKMAKFMEGDFDVTMNADASAILSKPLQQAKITEMFGLIALNPALTSTIDPTKAVQRYLKINDEDPKDWMRGKGLTDEQWKRIAQQEDAVMKTGIPLVPTDGATQQHTEEHLNFTETGEYNALPPAIQQVFMDHIMGEHQAAGGGLPAMPGMDGPAPTEPMAAQGALGSNTPPEAQVADLQPSTPAGANAQDAQRQAVSA